MQQNEIAQLDVELLTWDELEIFEKMVQARQTYHAAAIRWQETVTKIDWEPRKARLAEIKAEFPDEES